ncbi:MAG: acyl-CoA dehydratase activase [Syntrophobacteraceae bacterium]|jgi:predicted CoA-substrate-specific enzyme activase
MSKGARYFAGVDVGSVSVKAVLLSRRKLLASEVAASGGNYRETTQKVIDAVLARTGIAFDRLSGIIVTGLGGGSSPFSARQVSDITCNAMGSHVLFPSARTVIDIGGQFTKVARITPQGRVADFLMSEKCATGSGRFLQIIARILQVKLEDIGPLSMESEKPVEFSTNCAVFAESETVSRIAEGAKPRDILAGVHRAMASKVSMLVKRLKIEPDVVLTGGCGEDAGLVQAIGHALGIKIFVPREPRITAAFGAACLAEAEICDLHRTCQ